MGRACNHNFSFMIWKRSTKELYDITNSQIINLLLMNGYTLSFISNTVISNATLKLARNRANVKQHP